MVLGMVSYGKELYNKYVDLFNGNTPAASFDTSFHSAGKAYRFGLGSFSLEVGSEVEGSVGGKVVMPLEVVTEQKMAVGPGGGNETNAVFRWKDASKKFIPQYW
jgi:hypothetical protein